MKKFTSVILSVALLCTVIFPAVKFVASADDEKSAAIAAASKNVKEAWGNLQETYEIPLLGYRQVDTGTLIRHAEGKTTYKTVTNAQLSGEDENFDNTGLPEGITTKEFGSGYFSFATNNNTSGASDGHDAVLFDMTNNSVWKGKADIAISDIADIYVYYKTSDETAPEDTSTVNSRFYIVNSSSTTYTYDSSAPVFAAPINTKGWQKLSVKYAAPGFLEGCKSNLTGNFMRFNVAFGYGFKSTVTMGGAFVAIKVPTPAGLDSLEGVELLKEYYKNDYTGYVNADALALAILDLEQAIGEDAYLAKLQIGWQNLKKPVQMSLFKYTNSDGNVTENDIAVPAGPTDDKNIVGDKTRTITVASKTNFDGGKDRLVFQLPKADIDGLEDLTFAYKVNGTVTGTHSIRLKIASDYAIYADTNKLQDIVLDTSEGWHTVKVSDFFKGTTTWQTILEAYAANQINNLFRLFIFHNAALSITYGTPMVIKDSGTYPTEETSNWSLNEWIAAVREVDIDNYCNSELFLEGYNSLLGTYADSSLLPQIKEAYANLAVKFYSECTYLKHKDDNGADAPEPELYYSLGNTPSGVTAEQLGTYWQSISIASNENFNTQKNLVVFSSSSYMDVESVADGELYYRVADCTSGTPTVKLQLVSSDYKTSIGDKSIALENDGQWHSFKISDFYSAEDWQSVAKTGWTSASAGKLHRVFVLHNASTATIEYGSVCLSQKMELPSSELTANWTIADWVARIETLNFSTLVDSAEISTVLADAKKTCEELGIERYHTTVSYPSATDLDLSEKVNSLSGAVPSVVFNNGIDNILGAEGCAVLNDGLYKEGFKINGYEPISQGENCYADISYELTRRVNVEGIAVAFPSEQVNSLKYELYVSDTKDKLFTTSSKVLTYDNTAEPSQAQYFTFENTGLSGRYFGIRVFIDSAFAEANGGKYDLSLTEFGIYGKESGYYVETGSFSNVKMQSYGKNLLANSDVVYSAYINKSNVNNVKVENSTGIAYYESEDRPVTNITDLRENTNVVFNYLNAFWEKKEAERSLQLVFDLRRLYSIDKLLVNNLFDGEKAFFTGSYEIYVSDSLLTLYLPENCVLDYNNMSDSENGTSRSQAFSLINPAVGRYVALKITSPISDWEYAEQNNLLNRTYARLADFGAFGEVYNKPLEKENLLKHVVSDVYKTDANGERTRLGDSDYNGEAHALIYDGSLDAAATVKTDSKQIDFVFSLPTYTKFNEITLNTLEPQIKAIKIYACKYKSGIWNENSLIYSFKSDEPADCIIKDFGESGLQANYLRYSIITVTGDELQVTEIGAFGWNTQEFDYKNLIEEDIDAISYYVQDKTTNEVTPANPRANIQESSWGGGKKDRPVTYLVDGNHRTVCDLSNGEQGTDTPKSLNLLIDMGDLKAIDEISFLAGSNEEYWPTKLNFYFGINNSDLFAESAVPSKVFDSRSADGEYSYKFLPQYARYVRIEVLEGTSDYDKYNHRILAVISELRVNGLSVVANEDYGQADSKTAVENLKTAWKNLKLKLVETTLYKYVDRSGNITQEPNDFAVDADPTDDQKVVGSKTRTISVAQTTPYSNNERIMFKVPYENVTSLTDMVFSYKINSINDPSKANIKILIQGSGQYITGVSPRAVSLDTDREWHTFKVSDLLSQCMSDSWDTWEEIISAWNTNNTNGLYLIIYHDAMTAEITYGTPIALQDTGTYPTKEELNELGYDPEKWLLAAKDIDPSGWYGESDFLKARAALEATYPEVYTVDSLKSAYSKLAVHGSDNYYKGTTFYDKSGNITPVNPNATPFDGYDGATAEQLGAYWHQVTVSYKFLSSSGYNKNSLCFGNKEISIDSISDGRIYYRITSGSSIPAKLYLANSSTGYIESNSVTLNADGAWHSLCISDFFGNEDWKTNALGNSISSIRIFHLPSFNQSVTIQYGCINFYKPIDKTGMENWDIKSALMAANKALTYDLLDATELKTAFESGMESYNNANPNATIKEGDCTLNGEVNICDLIRLKSYLKDDTVEIFGYALTNDCTVNPSQESFDKLQRELLSAE